MISKTALVKGSPQGKTYLWADLTGDPRRSKVRRSRDKPGIQSFISYGPYSIIPTNEGLEAQRKAWNELKEIIVELALRLMNHRVKLTGCPMGVDRETRGAGKSIDGESEGYTECANWVHKTVLTKAVPSPFVYKSFHQIVTLGRLNFGVLRQN